MGLPPVCLGIILTLGYVSIREGRAKPLREPPSVLRMGRRSDFRHIVTLMRHAHITLFVHTHIIQYYCKPYRHGTSRALRLCTCALLECCQPLLRCRTLPRRVDDGCLGGCCFGGCLGGSRLTPLSLLALALWTRTLAAISLTISQRLLLLAALRRRCAKYCMYSSSVSKVRRSRSGDTSRGGSQTQCRMA